jgi:hypothetical protein
MSISAKLKVSASKSATSPSCKTLYAILGDTLQPTNPITKTIILTKINENKILFLQPI